MAEGINMNDKATVFDIYVCVYTKIPNVFEKLNIELKKKKDDLCIIDIFIYLLWKLLHKFNMYVCVSVCAHTRVHMEVRDQICYCNLRVEIKFWQLLFIFTAPSH